MKGGNGIDYIKIRELIQRAAGTYGKANVRLFDATVLSVDIPSRTCVIDSIDHSLTGITARLMLEISDGDFSVPSVDSTVTVAMTDFTDPYIVDRTWIDKKLFVVGDQSYSIINGSQIFNDGKYGGIPIVINPDDSNAGLLKRINNLENLLNDLISKFNTHTHILVLSGCQSGSGGTGTANATTSQETGSVTITQQSQISNPNITHGDKF